MYDDLDFDYATDFKVKGLMAMAARDPRAQTMVTGVTDELLSRRERKKLARLRRRRRPRRRRRHGRPRGR